MFIHIVKLYFCLRPLPVKSGFSSFSLLVEVVGFLFNRDEMC